MEFSVRSLPGWAVPRGASATTVRVFAESGEVQDDTVEQQLRPLGEEAVRVPSGSHEIPRFIGRSDVMDPCRNCGFMDSSPSRGESSCLAEGGFDDRARALAQPGRSRLATKAPSRCVRFVHAHAV
jgi:hypothetical protein